MIIANFREYISVLREIYSQDAMGEILGYYQEMADSGKILNIRKAELQQKISKKKKIIEALAKQIRTATDKKEAGLKLAEIKRQKQALVTELKKLRESDHFNVLSEEAKTSVCSGFLLQKYLARELLENNPLDFSKDAEGNLVVDPQKLRNADIFQEAGHIRDFVAAYLNCYPEKVKTPGHFKTMLNGVTDWAGLLNYANDFFEKLNDNDFLEEGLVKASRQGTEVIKVWPERKLQIVRLHTAHALDYESEKMDHCVGKGGYDSQIKSGKTYIYSLRDYSEEGEWLPHATIEYADGEVKQVKGYKNKDVAAEYLPFLREFVFHLCGSDDVQHLNAKQKIRDLKNWGYLTDVNGKLHDIYNLQEDIELAQVKSDDEFFNKIDVSRIKVHTFVFSKPLNEDVLRRLEKFKLIKEVSLSSDEKSPEMMERLFSILRNRNGTGGIVLSELNLSSLFIVPEDVGDVRVERLICDSGMRYTPELIQKFKQFGKIEKFDITGISGGFLLMKEYLAKKCGSSEPLEIEKLLKDSQQLKNLGYALHRRKSGFDVGDVLCVWIDLTNVTKAAEIAHLAVDEMLMSCIQPELLSLGELKLTGRITPEMIAKIGRFNKICDITFEKADFTGFEKLDLSGIRNMGERAEEETDVFSLLDRGFIFENGQGFKSIPKMVSGYDVKFFDCVNLPDAGKIIFPPQIQHLMIGWEEKSVLLSELRLESYPELKTLQLNCFDLRQVRHFCVPENIEYLGIGDCILGKQQELDLSGYKHLKEVRLTCSDVSGINQFVFPDGLEKVGLDNVAFSNKTALDFSNCKNLKSISMFCNGRREKVELRDVVFPPAVEGIHLDYGLFDNLKVLDFSRYPALKKVSLTGSSFPNLEKMVIPACHFEGNGLKFSPKAVLQAQPTNDPELLKQREALAFDMQPLEMPRYDIGIVRGQPAAQR